MRILIRMMMSDIRMRTLTNTPTRMTEERKRINTIMPMSITVIRTITTTTITMVSTCTIIHTIIRMRTVTTIRTAVR